jgi:hypothetical protein
MYPYEVCTPTIQQNIHIMIIDIMVIDVHGEQGMAPLQSTPIKKNFKLFCPKSVKYFKFYFCIAVTESYCKKKRNLIQKPQVKPRKNLMCSNLSFLLGSYQKLVANEHPS